jgi:hypothetical protein
MARLYVVAFSKNKRWVGRLANPPLCVYNPDSPQGTPLGLNPSSVQLSSLRERTGSLAGHKVIFEHEHWGGKFRLSPGGTGRPIAAKRKKPNPKNSKCQKFQNHKKRKA